MFVSRMTRIYSSYMYMYNSTYRRMSTFNEHPSNKNTSPSWLAKKQPNKLHESSTIKLAYWCAIELDTCQSQTRRARDASRSVQTRSLRATIDRILSSCHPFSHQALSAWSGCRRHGRASGAPWGCPSRRTHDCRWSRWSPRGGTLGGCEAWTAQRTACHRGCTSGWPASRRLCLPGGIAHDRDSQQSSGQCQAGRRLGCIGNPAHDADIFPLKTSQRLCTIIKH